MKKHQQNTNKIILMIFSLIFMSQVTATEYFIDPQNGNMNGDGSSSNPWSTLQEVIDADLIETRNWDSFPPDKNTPLVTVNAGAPIKAGDTIWLRTGYHGSLSLLGAYNTSVISIMAEIGHQPQIADVSIQAAQHWKISGLLVSPSFATPATEPSNIVSINNHNFFGASFDIEFSNNEIFTQDDTSSWGATEWIDDAISGINIGAERISVVNNLFRNLRFGISVTGSHNLISNNIVDGFSADGIRGLGDDNIYEYNRIQNCYVSSSQGDGNHDDGFQSWSVGDNGVGTGVVNNVILRGNIFINYTDPDNPLNATMQGIGCFDGQFTNWTVVNNVVITNHWHGISFYGVHDSQIINNTVVDINDTSPGPSWIKTAPYNGIESNNVVVRNNLANTFSLAGQNITDDHNTQVTSSNINDLFVNLPYNLQLKLGSAAIDAGEIKLAPKTDILGNPRSIGIAPDLGAYEYLGDLIFSDSFDK